MAPSRGSALIALIDHKLPTRCPRHARAFASTNTLCSGHNRWSKIKHDKGKNDAVKNRARAEFSKEITLASKMFGPDVNTNNRLADIITKAKREGFAKASIEAAIARGQGRSTSGTNLETMTVEGMLPGNVGVIVECETDNRNRTMQAVKLALKGAGGSASPCSFLFEKRGRINFEQKEGIGVEEVLDAALEAGATDVEEAEDEGGIVVYCDPTDTKAVGESVAAGLNLEISSSEIIWFSNEDTRVAVPSEQAADDLGSFMDDLHDKDSDVSGIAMNISQGSLNSDSWNELRSRLSA